MRYIEIPNEKIRSVLIEHCLDKFRGVPNTKRWRDEIAEDLHHEVIFLSNGYLMDERDVIVRVWSADLHKLEISILVNEDKYELLISRSSIDELIESYRKRADEY